jgi:hypothetical protein
MKEIAIPEDLLAELKKIHEDIGNARAGLNHFSERLKIQHKVLWSTINEALPESKGWVANMDFKRGVVTLLYPEKERG